MAIINLVVFLVCLACCAVAYDVAFDGRSFFVKGERKLFIGGSVHYPRAPTSEWKTILTEAKNNGINLIQTYVFWDLHEPKDNEWDFPSSPTSSSNLVAFIQEADALGLYVNLRISGYVCAEWNMGGLPVWLRNLNSTWRTYDEPWLTQLSQFFEKTISVVRDANLFAADGGPIVMLQMENEYGNLESYYGAGGRKYVEWLSEYALSLDVRGTPWIMCQQGEGTGTAPFKEIVNTCNGFYCDNWISQHASDFPNQPHMWTENWPGWFQKWGEPIPHRPAVDVAFAVARWFARGGSYMNYYMAFGGSNYGRTVGGPLIVTSYDYDVQINEYALRSEPKFSLLTTLHSHLQEASDILLGTMPPAGVSLNGHRNCESHTYRLDDGKCFGFLSNWDDASNCDFPLGLSKVTVPAWSVTLVGGSNCSTVLFNTKTSVKESADRNTITATPVTDFELEPFSSHIESIPSTGVKSIQSEYPLEQLQVTEDSTDYLWYSVECPDGDYFVEKSRQLQFRAGVAGGGVMYVFAEGEYVGGTISDAGEPPMLPNDDYKISRSSEFVKSERKNELKALDTDTLLVNIGVTIPSTSSRKPRLDILSVSMGLKNYGPYLEKMQVGIVSNVTLDSVVLTQFTHRIGLNGEVANIPTTAVSVSKKYESKSLSNARLSWYSSSFVTPAEVTDSTHLAIDIANSLGKGAIWVNGQMLGRYWNVTAQPIKASRDTCSSLPTPPETCASENYTGSYNGDRCRTGCGLPSQNLYKLPTQWLHDKSR